MQPILPPTHPADRPFSTLAPSLFVKDGGTPDDGMYLLALDSTTGKAIPWEGRPSLWAYCQFDNSGKVTTIVIATDAEGPVGPTYEGEPLETIKAVEWAEANCLR